MIFNSSRGSLLFISMSPDSIGHRYRVLNHAESFERLGFTVLIASPAQADSLFANSHDLCLIIIFRAQHDLNFKRWRRCADQLGIPLLIDLDDLTFDPALFETGQWSFWEALPQSEKQRWSQRVLSQRLALLDSDGALVSTEPLADAVRLLNVPAWVWTNGFSTESWDFFRKARRHGPLCRSPHSDGIITIGYASGTPTHTADFEVVASALARLMTLNFSIRLCIVGSLNLANYPSLEVFEDRIDLRPLVPYSDLPMEYARFDINLAPLEVHSSFCQCKSALKFFESAAVGVPTVASPTQPFMSLIRHRFNGCLAFDSNDWFTEMHWLLKRRRRRLRIANFANITIRRFCSPSSQYRELLQVFRQLPSSNF